MITTVRVLLLIYRRVAYQDENKFFKRPTRVKSSALSLLIHNLMTAVKKLGFVCRLTFDTLDNAKLKFHPGMV